MEIVFERLGEYSKFNIDRKNKILKATGPETNYVEEQLPWEQLCDPGKVEVQLKELEALDDKTFAKTLGAQMNIFGFNMIKCQY